jgi:hypothetical protein
MTNAQAIADAETRFVALLADRTKSATLWANAGQIIWSTRRFILRPGNADAVAGGMIDPRLAEGFKVAIETASQLAARS